MGACVCECELLRKRLRARALRCADSTLIARTGACEQATANNVKEHQQFIVVLMDVSILP
jgi:hypothetical protein